MDEWWLALSMRSHGFRLKLHPQGFKEAELLVRSMRLKQWLWGSVDMDVWQNLLHRHIKQINKCWNFYIEVENGGIQKVTTIGIYPFFTPMIMGGRVSQNKFKTNYLEEILEIKTWIPWCIHDSHLIPWFSTKLRSDRFQHLTQLGNLQRRFPPVLYQSPKRMLIVLYQKDVDSSPLNQTVLICGGCKRGEEGWI